VSIKIADWDSVKDGLINRNKELVGFIKTSRESINHMAKF